MMLGTIPIKLSLAESGAVALDEAANDLDAAGDAEAFIAALDRNHRLWLTLSEIAKDGGWDLPDDRLAEFVMTVSCRCGKGVHDDDVEALIGINRDLSRKLVAGHDVAAVRRRVELAWTEAGRPNGQPLELWLIGEMRRRSRVH